MGTPVEPEHGSEGTSNGVDSRSKDTSENGSSESQQISRGSSDSSNGKEQSTGSKANGVGSHSPSDKSKSTAKFLMSNTAAGSIIGKGGSNINELQRVSGAKLQLSRPMEFFPGTNERVLTASGSIMQLANVINLILTACQDDIVKRSEGSRSEDEDMDLKFLAPSAVCGVLIGKAGSNIKSFAKESNTNITVSSLHEQLPGVSERVVLITGQIPEIVAALRLLLRKLQESSHYGRLSNVPVNYQSGAMDWGVHRFATNGLAQALPILPAPTPNGVPPAETELCLQVPDARIGAIIGKGGDIITSIKNLFDVGIRISDRETFVPGTRDREIVISGAPHSVHLANQLIHQRISAAETSAAPLTSRRRQ